MKSVQYALNIYCYDWCRILPDQTNTENTEVPTTTYTAQGTII